MSGPTDLRRWLPAAAAGLVILIVLVAALVGDDDDGNAGNPADAVATTTTFGSASASTSTTAPVVITQPAATIPHTPLGRTLSVGSSGDEVAQVQQRLTELGFAPGPIDGSFGSGTQQAVWAFEALVELTARQDLTGTVTNEMWQRMQDNLTFAPLRPSGPGTTHVEVFVPQQVLIVFTDDSPTLIAHISTGLQLPDGRPDHFCEYADYNTDARGVPLAETITKYVCADTKTPGGVFPIDHMLPGNHSGPLGGMYNPVYINYGIAIHGAQNVPAEPVSHGCIRLNMAIAEYFPTLVSNGDTVYVWAQDGKQPEEYTTAESLPSFNAVSEDPNATTTSTTSTTSTTTTSTTVTTDADDADDSDDQAPATTTAPTAAATAPAATTTTTAPAVATTVASTPATAVSPVVPATTG